MRADFVTCAQAVLEFLHKSIKNDQAMLF